MNYISKKGKAAAESATAEKKDFSKSLVPFKSGTTYKVRLASDEDYCEYMACSVFKIFYTSPVAPDNLYQKAVDLLYADAKQSEDAGDSAKAEEIRDQAYQLKPKPRYLFGFINLADGQPIIVDTSKAQAKVLIAAIEKYAKKIGKVAFELSKDGQGTSTTVSLSPVLDMDDDLSDVERTNFEKASDTQVPDDLYENVLYVKDADEQQQDLVAFGFDVSRLGLDGGTAQSNDPTDQF
jgi:hypothetical protein